MSDLMMHAAQRLVDQSPTYPPNLAPDDPVRIMHECMARMDEEVAMHELAFADLNDELRMANQRADAAEEDLELETHRLEKIRDVFARKDRLDDGAMLAEIATILSRKVPA